MEDAICLLILSSKHCSVCLAGVPSRLWDVWHGGEDAGGQRAKLREAPAEPSEREPDRDPRAVPRGPATLHCRTRWGRTAAWTCRLRWHPYVWPAVSYCVISEPKLKTLVVLHVLCERLCTRCTLGDVCKIVGRCSLILPSGFVTSQRYDKKWNEDKESHTLKTF